MIELNFPMEGALTYWECGLSMHSRYALGWLQEKGIEECMPAPRTLNEILGEALKRVYSPRCCHIDPLYNEKEGYTVISITSENTPEGRRNHYLHEQTIVPDHETGYCASLEHPFTYKTYIETVMEEEKTLLRTPQIEELVNKVATHLRSFRLDYCSSARYMPEESLPVWRDFARHMNNAGTYIYIVTAGVKPEEAKVFIHSLVRASREMTYTIERKMHRAERDYRVIRRDINEAVDLLVNIENYLEALKKASSDIEELVERSREAVLERKLEVISSESES